ncbi:MAG: kinase [Spirochaetes bacterium GWD1_27_9]|nr:MAG: kinase [Spirochaetes bacterium GWB1_27_13]OHD21830.1 MAG: kinase [Spirochaetes bacterium GWC1_27_15]OHD30026.1 MAG: kinase [Spirochaetes bacterium GWD1_27_9]
MKNKVLVVGGTCYCTLVNLNELPEPKTQHLWSSSSYSTIGHMGSGKSLNLNRLGLKTTLHSFIGNDDNGRKIIEYFKKEKINFVYDFDPAGTDTHINLMDKHGQRISITTNSPTFKPEIDLQKFEKLIEENDFIALNIVNYTRYLIPLIKKHNKEIWCDLGDYKPNDSYFNDFAENADYITMSSTYLDDYKQVMENLMSMGKKLVVCTHGSKGATALTLEGQFIETPIIDSYKLVDSNGAGDSFFSGLLYSHTQDYTIEKSMKIATIVAGLCIASKELFNEDLTTDLLKLEYKKYYNTD